MYVVTIVSTYVRMYVHATYTTPCGPQDSNKPPYPPWSMVFIMSIKKQIFLLEWEKFADTSKECETTGKLFCITDNPLLITICIERDSKQETTLATYCTMLEKNMFLHTRTHARCGRAHARAHTRMCVCVCVCIWIALMKATYYNVSLYLLFIRPLLFPLSFRPK